MPDCFRVNAFSYFYPYAVLPSRHRHAAAEHGRGPRGGLVHHEVTVPAGILLAQDPRFAEHVRPVFEIDQITVVETIQVPERS